MRFPQKQIAACTSRIGSSSKRVGCSVECSRQSALNGDRRGLTMPKRLILLQRICIRGFGCRLRAALSTPWVSLNPSPAPFRRRLLPQQSKHSKEGKTQAVAVGKVAQASSSVKTEPKVTKPPLAILSSCGWQQESISIRERQASPPHQDKLPAARAVNRIANGPDAGGKARSRGGRTAWRGGGGKVKSTKPVLVQAAPVRSVETSRKSDGGGARGGGGGGGSGDDEKVSTPVPPPQECAEQKEASSPDLLLSQRKSPRSKEVRTTLFVLLGRGAGWGVAVRPGPLLFGSCHRRSDMLYEVDGRRY